jgi:hypothetical protein
LAGQLNFAVADGMTSVRLGKQRHAQGLNPFLAERLNVPGRRFQVVTVAEADLRQERKC